MNQEKIAEVKSDEHAGEKFYINIEGREYPWDKDTITTQEIRTLGNLPTDLPVVEEKPDGVERTLAENEVIELKPGHRFGRAPKYKRGYVMNERVRNEIDLVRQKYPDLQHGNNLDWVFIPEYPLPKNIYNRSSTKFFFLIPNVYPNSGPDNFFVESGFRLFDGSLPNSYNEGSTPTGHSLPVPGTWGWFSWHPEKWQPAAVIEEGDNLLAFFKAVNIRLREGK